MGDWIMAVAADDYMRQWILVAATFAVGICAGWGICRRRVSKELQALKHEARDARSLAGQQGEKLRRQLHAARAGEEEARRALAQLEDRLSEYSPPATNADEQVGHAPEDLADFTGTATTNREETEQLRRQMEESRQELIVAQAEVERSAKSLQETTGRIEHLEAAARTAAETQNELRQALEDERRRRRGGADRVAELTAEMRRLKEEGSSSAGDDRAEKAISTGAQPPSPSPGQSESPMSEAKGEKEKVEAPSGRSAPSPDPEPRTAVEQVAPALAASDAPTVLDVLDADSQLNEGQREVIRVTYSSFAPKATKTMAGPTSPNLTVPKVLESDPNLNRGQRETICAMYDQFVRRAKARPSAS